MEIVSNKKEIIFKSKKDDKTYYSIGMSKKKQDGTYENGYMNVHFKKDVNIENKTKIMIKSAWLDFYTKNKITVPYIFINEFEVIEDNDNKENKDDNSWESGKNIQIEPDDLPFY